MGASFVVWYIVRNRSADVNIPGSTHLLGRKSRRISVRKDKRREKGIEWVSRFVEDEVLPDCP